LPNRSGESATGKARPPSRKRCTPTGGASGEHEANGCRPSEGRKSNANFAHQFDTGGMDRLYVRGLVNVHKKLLLQAAACNLALLLRSLYGAGKPRAAHDRIVETILAILAFMSVVESLSQTWLRTHETGGLKLAK
jgi:hypothetical protein